MHERNSPRYRSFVEPFAVRWRSIHSATHSPTEYSSSVSRWPGACQRSRTMSACVRSSYTDASMRDANVIGADTYRPPGTGPAPGNARTATGRSPRTTVASLLRCWSRFSWLLLVVNAHHGQPLLRDGGPTTAIPLLPSEVSEDGREHPSLQVKGLLNYTDRPPSKLAVCVTRRRAVEKFPSTSRWTRGYEARG